MSANSSTGPEAIRPLVEKLTDSHAELKLACFTLLDNIKKRYPQESRRLWKCGDFDRIAKLIDFH